MILDTLEVRGHSMRFLLRPGDRLRLERVPAERLRAGDVIVIMASRGAAIDPLRPDTPLRVHRLLQKRLHEGRWQLRTRGDSTAAADPWLEESAVVGRVREVLRDGRRRRLDTLAGACSHRLVGAASSLLFRLLWAARPALLWLLARLLDCPGPGARALRRPLCAFGLWLEAV